MKTQESNKMTSGFTLIEMLLVIVIVSTFIMLGIGYVEQRTLTLRVDRASAQMQQILNASLAYYVANGSWPTALPCLQGVGALPCQSYLPGALTSPWGQNYTLKTTPSNIYVYTPIVAGTDVTARNQATIVAGRLPLSYITGDPTSGANLPPAQIPCAGTTCYVVSSVTIPGQNLNNASAVNFAGLYHHGGCVPVPQCPVDANGNTMTPQVMIVPVSVSGLNDFNSLNVYPISSFTGYATGGTDTAPPACTGGNFVGCSPTNGPASTRYWRACLQIVTQRGDVSTTNSSAWGQYVTLMAITRCAISNEPAGSTFAVFSS